MPGTAGGDSGAGGDQGKSTPTEITIQVDGADKVVTAEEVGNLIAGQAALTQRSQEVAPLLKTLERYGTDAETYLEQSEGALSVVGQLIEKGIIGEDGTILAQKPVVPVKPAGTELNPNLGTASEKKVLDLVTAAIGEATKPLTDQLAELREDQTRLLRENTANKVKAKFPHFTDANVSELFVRASRDRRTPLWDHAEAYDKGLKEVSNQQEIDFAKKYGLDLDGARNKLKEQGSEGGVMSGFKGKKFSFSKVASRRGTADAVSPMEAMETYFKDSKGE